jgi:hypothetical protein
MSVRKRLDDPRRGDRAPIDLLKPYLPPKKPPAPSLKTRRRTDRRGTPPPQPIGTRKTGG